MTISKLMAANPITILQNATLRDALELMEKTGCHHLPVVNQHGVLVGVLTSHFARQCSNDHDAYYSSGTHFCGRGGGVDAE